MIYIYLLDWINKKFDGDSEISPHEVSIGEDFNAQARCDGRNFLLTDFKDEGMCFEYKDLRYQLLVMFYFISTTVSTVGLGDFRPVSDIERLEILPYMLFGYLLFSYLISEVQFVTKQLIHSISTNEDLRGLNMFISTIRKMYNSNLPLMNNYEDKLYEFFHFYWAN